MAYNRDDLTQGGILKKLLCVAVPIMGTQLMQMAYNLTDMFWLGRMEDSVMAVAASGLAGMFLFAGRHLVGEYHHHAVVVLIEHRIGHHHAVAGSDTGVLVSFNFHRHHLTGSDRSP